jgi:hypothetical protein
MIRALLLATLLAGCGGGATMGQLTRRASFDLNCPEPELQLVQIDRRTVGARGCDRQATYVETCRSVTQLGQKRGCTWVLNSPSGAASDPPGSSE